MNEMNYWWVTRPKRKLNSIPEILAVYSNVALQTRWTGNRNIHLQFEEELEKSGLKRVGARRDHAGSGGRTYAAWLFSLGLIFFQNDTGMPYLTLSGEAIMEGKSPVEILKCQVLKYQFPSPYSIKNHVSAEFKIHPFHFLLRLLIDKRIRFLTQEEIAKVVITEAKEDTDNCFEYVVNRILAFREYGDSSLPEDFFEKHMPRVGKIRSFDPFGHLNDIANTLVNWLDYTQLIVREDYQIKILPDKMKEVNFITSKKMPFIQKPDDDEFFQRKYGLDPYHVKDTRNLLNTSSITSRTIEMQRIRQAFITLSMHRPIGKITHDLVLNIAESTGTDYSLVENVIYKDYPHGAIGGFLSGYYEMAFKGRDEAVEFEVATTNIFKEVFGYNAIHLGQTGSKSAPDILLISDNEGYQSIIDNKAYSKYSITGDHHNRMVHNYLEKVDTYSNSSYPIGFFSYISGGFAENFDIQIKKEIEESSVSGSGISVSNFIRLIQKHQENPYTHSALRNLFGIGRQIRLTDF